MTSIQDDLRSSSELALSLASDQSLLQAIEAVVELCIGSLKAGGKILFAGNGGSAADAQHMAGEFVSRFNYDRPGLALGHEGDVLFAYSTSGNSPNILRALDAAKGKKMTSVGLTGNRGGAMNSRCDYLLAMPSAHTPRIQEGHLMVGHAICAAVEARLFPR
ncbi:MAG: SIS domain-containing protein [Betaproteobacteria bacterium]|nr:SIS domain-containing protein [Betaproteobacteria bacterium]